MSEYYILITNAGSAREAEAHANGETVNLSHFGICDGGVDFVPDHTATVFENEVYRGAISSLTVSEADDTILVAKCIIPAASGGYTVRGIAIYTDDGLLYATGNYPNQEKPLPETGFSASLEINAEMAVSHTSDITLVVPDDAFLTPDQADLLYLRQDKHLAEIAARGAAAQAQSRTNIGCGTAAAANVEDFLPADYTPPAAPVTSVNGETGEVQLSAGDVGAYSKEESDIRFEPIDSAYTKAESDARYLQGSSAVITGIRLANYGDIYGNLRDSAHTVMTGIYETNGYDNPTHHEHRKIQYQIGGNWYDAPYV